MLARVIYNKSHYSRHTIDNQLSRKAHTFRRRIHRRCGRTITAGCICVCAFNNFVSYTAISRTHNTCAYMDANRVNRVHERVQQITWFTMPSCCRPHRLFWPVLNYSDGDRRDKAEPAARLPPPYVQINKRAFAVSSVPFGYRDANGQRWRRLYSVCCVFFVSASWIVQWF